MQTEVLKFETVIWQINFSLNGMCDNLPMGACKNKGKWVHFIHFSIDNNYSKMLNNRIKKTIEFEITILDWKKIFK